MNAKKRNHRRTGAAAVEFAVAATVLIMIVFASIEFVRLNIIRHSVDHASYLAARKGIIYGANIVDVKNTARDHLTVMGVVGAVITVSPDPIGDDTSLVEVSIDVPVGPNAWITPAYFGGTINARSRMLAERGVSDMNNATAPPAPPAQ